MKRIALVIGVLTALVLGFKASPVVAEGVMQVSENLTSVKKEATVDGAAFLGGESVNVQGTVKGDVYCAAQTVTIDGTVDGDVLCAGGSVTINGTVHGDIRAVAQTVTINGTVDGSVTLAGQNLNTGSASKIGRDAVITANTIGLSGSVGRDVMAAASSIIFNGPVGRDVKIAAEHVIVSDVKIGGVLNYTSENAADIGAGATIGSVQHQIPDTRHTTQTTGMSGTLVGIFIIVMMFVVVTLGLMLVAPRYVHRVSNVSSTKQFLSLFLVGLVSLVVTPFLFVILLLTVVGIYAAFVLGVAVTLGFMVGASLVAYRLGRFMLNDTARPLMSALVGSLALGVFSVIPFIGWLLAFVTSMIGFGMLVMGMKSQYETAPVPVRKTTKPTRS